MTIDEIKKLDDVVRLTQAYAPGFHVYEKCHAIIMSKFPILVREYLSLLEKQNKEST